MAFTLPPLPFNHDALASRGMSKDTLELHHGKHHQGYVTALNGLVEKNPALQGKTLEELMDMSFGDKDMAGVFNNAGQHFNHAHFWQSLSPEGGVIPTKLEGKIVEDFGGVEKFKELFTQAATGQFGSGWAWLVQKPDGRLAIARTANGSNPVAEKIGRPLLSLDVWEHSYYLDFKNLRAAYAGNYLDKLANYAFAESLMA